MSKNNDLYSLGEAYGKILDGVNVVEEQVPAGEIGAADLVTKDTGPTEKGGFKEAEVDITKAGDKENKYNKIADAKFKKWRVNGELKSRQS